MHTGGGGRAHGAIARARRRLSQPATALAALARLVLTSAVAAAPSLIVAVVQDPVVRPTAAVVTQPGITDLPWVGPPSEAAVSEAVGPAPPAALTRPGMLAIPPIALTAYRNADGLMARSTPECGVGWNLLAGIGQIESRHAFGGAADDRGDAVDPIFGPTLDGSLPGNEIIVASRSNGRTIYARAMGPMQFLPSTWTHYAADGNGDGAADPQNLFDSTLAAARYLCSGGTNLRDRSQLIRAVLRYNNSMSYTQNVLGWAEAYATGVPPGNLPPITGSTRPIGGVRTVSRPANVSPPAYQPAPAPPAQTFTERPAEAPSSGNAGRQGGSAGVAPPPTRAGSSSAGSSSVGSGATSAPSPRLGNRGTTTAGTGTSPKVTIGNGRTGGARG